MDYIDFQEQTTPLAYFISFRCYGTWLHGDRRESVDRRSHNKFGSPKIPDRLNLRKVERSNLRSAPFCMNQKMHSVVRSAIKEVCAFRGYRLFAQNVRSNHAHSVVAGAAAPEKIMSSFKSYSTRKLRGTLLVANDQKIWSRHGSTIYLWRESQLDAAIDYVMYSQDDDIPDFI
jgi:REP element-mobilizing transposase RayT